MKRAILLLTFLILIIIPNINAGQVYNLNFDDSKEIDSQTLTLEQKDRVDFDIIEGTHTIIINEIVSVGNISKDRIELDIFPFINREPADRLPVGYGTLHPGTQLKLDLNQDKYNDLSIRLVNLNKDEVTLMFTKMKECIFSDPKLCEKVEEPIKKEDFIDKIADYIKNINKTGLVIALVVIIVGLIFAFGFKKKVKH